MIIPLISLGGCYDDPARGPRDQVEGLDGCRAFHEAPGSLKQAKRHHPRFVNATARG